MSARSSLQHLSRARQWSIGTAAFATGLCAYSIYLDTSVLQSAGFAVVALSAWMSVSALFAAMRE
jgi:hypothetical protein